MRSNTLRFLWYRLGRDSAAWRLPDKNYDTRISWLKKDEMHRRRKEKLVDGLRRIIVVSEIASRDGQAINGLVQFACCLYSQFSELGTLTLVVLLFETLNICSVSEHY
jgi:hypothetical protein